MTEILPIRCAYTRLEFKPELTELSGEEAECEVSTWLLWIKAEKCGSVVTSLLI